MPQVYEKRAEPDAEEKAQGSRSIVFGLLPRGQKGLKQVGVSPAVHIPPGS